MAESLVKKLETILVVDDTAMVLKVVCSATIRLPG